MPSEVFSCVLDEADILQKTSGEACDCECLFDELQDFGGCVQSDPNQHGYVLGALLFLFSSSSKMGNLFSESITKQLFDGLYFESVVVCFNRLILIP